MSLNPNTDMDFAIHFSDFWFVIGDWVVEGEEVGNLKPDFKYKNSISGKDFVD